MKNKLPSAHQPGDKVNINFFDSGFIKNCEVIAVKFNKPKVSYDISIMLVPEDSESKALYTTIEGVDSICIVKDNI